MGYEFVLHRRASKQLSKLPTDVDERIRRKLREMVTNEFRDVLDYDVEPVAGVKYEIYRSRIGAYRVFFALDGETVAILHVDDRDGAYGDVTVLAWSHEKRVGNDYTNSRRRESRKTSRSDWSESVYLDTDVVLAELKDGDWVASEVEIPAISDPVTSVATCIPTSWKTNGDPNA